MYKFLQNHFGYQPIGYQILLLFCLIFTGHSLEASSSPGVTTIHRKIHTNSAAAGHIKIRILDETAIKSYRQLPEFQYNDESIVKSQSWWSRFWNWFWQMIRELFGDSEEEESTGQFAWRFLLIGAVVGAILYFVVKYMHLENIFRKKPETADIPYAESLKNIHEINFEKQIAEAVGKRNYKVAVRLHYLNVLKQLNDAGQIAWQPDKPNSVYLHELRDIKYRDSFGLLTRQFEYVWYGDFPLGEQAFENIDRHFADFKKMLP